MLSTEDTTLDETVSAAQYVEQKASKTRRFFGRSRLHQKMYTVWDFFKNPWISLPATLLVTGFIAAQILEGIRNTAGPETSRLAVVSVTVISQ